MGKAHPYNSNYISLLALAATNTYIHDMKTEYSMLVQSDGQGTRLRVN